MKRVTHATAAASPAVPDESGTSGYFTKANPRQGVGATWLTPEFLHRIQEELIAAQATVPANVADGAQLAAAIFSAGAYENRLINGGFDVWRFGGTYSSTEPGPSNMAADAWKAIASGETWTVVRQAFAPGQAEVPGNPRYYLRMENTGVVGAGNYTQLTQTITPDRGAHLGRTFAGETICLSFWARSNTPGEAAVELYRAGAVTGGAATSDLAETFALTTEWQEFAFPVNCQGLSPAGAAYAAGSLVVNLWLSAGSDYSARTNGLGNQSIRLDLARVSVVPGARPWYPERRIADEFALCATRCQGSFDYGVFPAPNAGLSGAARWPAVDAGTSNKTRLNIPLPVCLRNTPSIGRYNPAAATAYARNVTRSTNATAGSVSAGRATFMVLSSNAPAETQLNDEFAIHWTAVCA